VSWDREGRTVVDTADGNANPSAGTEVDPVTPPPRTGSRQADLRWRVGPTALVWAATAVLVTVTVIVFPDNLSFGSLATLTPLVGVLVVASLGQSLVIATGGIDLSVSSIITLTAIVVVYSSGGSDDKLPLACLLGLATGVVCGLINGLLVEYLRLSALVVTLATGQVMLGLANIWYEQGANKVPAPPALRTLAGGTVAGFSDVLIAGLVITAIIGVVLGGSVAGRRLSAASTSILAARYQGIAVKGQRAATYAAAGLLYSLCGMALVGILGTPTLALGAQYQLSTIAAVVLGGAALAGGRLRPGATLAGAVFLAISNQGVATTGLAAGAQSVAQGTILIIAMLLVTTGLLRKIRDRRTARAAGLDRADALPPSSPPTPSGAGDATS